MADKEAYISGGEAVEEKEKISDGEMTIDVDGGTYDIYPARDAQIDRTALDEELQHIPKLILDYGMLLASAEYDEGVAKLERDRTYAAIEQRVRSVEKQTEAAVKAAVVQAPGYIKACTTYLEACRRSADCKAFLQSMHAKKDAAIELFKSDAARRKYQNEDEDGEVAAKHVAARTKKEQKGER